MQSQSCIILFTARLSHYLISLALTIITTLLVILPSDSDSRLTQKIKEAGNLMDIQLLDHLILTTDDNYYSFADNGLL